MLCHRLALSVAVIGLLIFSASASAVQPGVIADLTMIPPDQAGAIRHLSNEGGVRGISDPALVYDNHQNEYVALRIPGESSPPYWLAEDIELGNLPSAATEWEITSYGYLTYAFDGTAPYDMTSRLYRFDLCTSMPTPLVEWNTGHCCVDPVEFPGTEAVFTVPWDGMVEVMYNLPAPVTVDEYFFMYLEYSGVNVAGNAGWVVAGDPEIGFTDGRWAEDFFNDGLRCWMIWEGRDPGIGFRAFVYGVSGAVMEMIPKAASGMDSIVGNEIFLDCHDLPQCVQVEVYARDWDPTGSDSPLVKGFQTTINCASYATAMAGTLTAVTDDCTPGFQGCDYCTMGVDKTHKDNSDVPDYIFWMMGDSAACCTVCLCDNGTPGDPYDDFPGFYKCLSGAANTYTDPGVPQYMNHYSFIVSADTKGTWEVSLDPRTLNTQLADSSPAPILPLARIPALLTVELGECCYNIGVGTIECTDGVTECECEALPGPQVFFPREECDWAGGYPYGCDVCLEESDCDDNNLCTTDDCCTYEEWDQGLCEHAHVCTRTDITPEGYCCVPQLGPLPIDDRDPCTYDWCDEEAGVLHHDVSTFCVMPLGCRYITARAPNGEDPVALLVVGDPDDPAVSCVSLYLQPDGTLGETAYFQTPAEWLGVFVHGEEIIPDSAYSVYINDGTTLSDPIEVTTFDWGDVDDNDVANVTDILLIISGFQGDFSVVLLGAVDLMPCEPDGIIGLADVMAPILAFQGVDYLDTTCSAPCP